jgi:hypothetical protein
MPASILTDETIARRVAGDVLADIRTVRREQREPGSVRGLVGERIRAALARYETPRPSSDPPPRVA